MEQKITYAFGSFFLDTDTQSLRSESGIVSLQPKIYRLLLYFLQHPDRLISKEELFDAVWQGRIVEDTALRLAINILRKALHDDRKMPSYILTSCRRGYRFVPEVAVQHGFQTIEPMLRAEGILLRPLPGIPENRQQFEAELDQLLQAFEQATEGDRRLVFLNGERRTGKTALLERFLAKIGHHEFALLRARCVPLNGAVEPFLPLLEALERRCRDPGGKPLIEFLYQFAPTWLQQVANVLEPEVIGSFRSPLPQLKAARMLREGANFFERLGSESTFILILDNSQWSDKFTLDLLNFLGSRSSPTRLLMIISFRPEENRAGARRLAQMRSELAYRSVFRELSLQKR